MNTEDFSAGDKVLLKRTFGSYPKLSVKWKEDCDGLPYTVMKRIGPVNYVLRNNKGVEKVYHRNLIKPALNKVEPTFTIPVSDPHDHTNRVTSTSIIVNAHERVPEQTLPAIDRQGFTENFFRSDDAPVVQPQPQTSRYGRT